LKHGKKGTAMRATTEATLTTEQDPRWTVVVNRDSSADGSFVYSVKTTGVFCRPSCPSRTAKPRNVRFHATAEEAVAEGFRPCLRCRPDLPPLSARRTQAVTRLCRLLERSDRAPTLDTLGRLTGLSPFHLQRLFKAETGLTPAEYFRVQRAKKMRGQLRARGSVTEAIYEAGYGSSARFYEESRATLGMTPSQFRAGGSALEIRYSSGHSSLGIVLVAATGQGLCAILLGDSVGPLLEDLARRFPSARRVPADASFAAQVSEVIAWVDAPGVGAALPLDIRGTAFQQRVWKALQGIPAGETTTYAQLAKAIGSPSATRAVAGACAANPLAIAIPCHRVVRSNGELSGYRWGIERKRALLGKEAAARDLLAVETISGRKPRKPPRS
jgi:AraC family transcriptional regulator, regulatory protein of adaptative response / methylated-DNA-[protein]-cysteine methyltransferase